MNIVTTQNHKRATCKKITNVLQMDGMEVLCSPSPWLLWTATRDGPDLPDAAWLDWDGVVSTSGQSGGGGGVGTGTSKKGSARTPPWGIVPEWGGAWRSRQKLGSPRMAPNFSGIGGRQNEPGQVGD